MKKLDNRLQAALDFIYVDDILADVGCDHGYLGIYAIKKGLSFVQLIDNKKGPLSKAEENLLLFEIEPSKFKLTLSNGLSDIDNRVNTISMMGMGGELISEIISFSKFDLNNVKLILQPNNRISFLREFLSNNFFEIINEKIVEEDDKFYELLVVKKTAYKMNYNYDDLFFGPFLRVEKSNCFIKKWSSILTKYNEIVKNSPKDADLTTLKKDIKTIERCLCQK